MIETTVPRCAAGMVLFELDDAGAIESQRASTTSKAVIPTIATYTRRIPGLGARRCHARMLAHLAAVQGLAIISPAGAVEL